MNNLPKIDYPILNIKLPSTKKSLTFRPFLVKEEKILLMAKESKNDADIFTAIKQIVQNCCLEKKFDVDVIPIFDLEYLFIKLRAFSIDSVIKISYRDGEDQSVYDFEVDLNEVEVEFPKKNENTIKINEDTGLIMKYPPASLYSDEEFLSLQKDHLFELIVRCVDKIYAGEEVYEAKNFSREQLSEFLENLNIKVFEKVHEFLLNSPKLNHVVSYKNKLGNDRKIVFSSLNDFFTWR
jgi:hypothetical protein